MTEKQSKLTKITEDSKTKIPKGNWDDFLRGVCKSIPYTALTSFDAIIHGPRFMEEKSTADRALGEPMTKREYQGIGAGLVLAGIGYYLIK